MGLKDIYQVANYKVLSTRNYRVETLFKILDVFGYVRNLQFLMQLSGAPASYIAELLPVPGLPGNADWSAF